MPKWDHLWIGGRIATLATAAPFGLIEKGAIAILGDQISWVGPESALPDRPERLANHLHRLDGKLLTPGLIDCHTHLIYAGNRAAEFVMRATGSCYEDIAKQGGGIQATVNATRLATPASLLAESSRRLQVLLAEGVTTIEIKSGYGLDLETERKILQVARELARLFPVTIRNSYLGLHAIPPQYTNTPDDYINKVINEILPTLHANGLIDYVDAWCERCAFTPAQIEKFFQKAVQLGIPIRLHVDQLSPTAGVLLATRYKALSVDHLEYTDESAIQAMAQAGTVAGLLPGAYYFLQEKKAPPLDLFRQYKIPMAIATDANPGTSPLTSLHLAMNMACILWQMTAEEVFAGVTRDAARALGLEKIVGTLEVDKKADFIIWDIADPTELIFQIGLNPLNCIVKNGKIL